MHQCKPWILIMHVIFDHSHVTVMCKHIFRSLHWMVAVSLVICRHTACSRLQALTHQCQYSQLTALISTNEHHPATFKQVLAYKETVFFRRYCSCTQVNRSSNKIIVPSTSRTTRQIRHTMMHNRKCSTITWSILKSEIWLVLPTSGQQKSQYQTVWTWISCQAISLNNSLGTMLVLQNCSLLPRPNPLTRTGSGVWILGLAEVLKPCNC